MIGVLSGGGGRGPTPGWACSGSSSRARLAAIVNVGDDTTLHGLSHQPRPGHHHLHPGRGHRPRARLGAGRRDVARDGGARPVRRAPARSARGPATPGSGWAIRTWPPTSTEPTAWPRGPRLTEVTAEIAAAYGVEVRLLPVTDDPRAHRGERGRRGRDRVPGVLRPPPPRRPDHRQCASTAPTRRRPPAATTAVLAGAKCVVIAPSNPIVSDRAGAGGARGAGTAGTGSGAGRRRVAHRRRPGAQGARRPDAGRARPSRSASSGSPGCTGTSRATLVIDATDAERAGDVEAEGVGAW